MGDHLLTNENLIQAQLFMTLIIVVVVHRNLQSCLIDILEIFSFNVPKHLSNLEVSVLILDCSTAEFASRPGWISVYPQHRYFIGFDHACCF